MNDEAVYRTAPATPGLLKIYINKVQIFMFIGCQVGGIGDHTCRWRCWWSRKKLWQPQVVAGDWLALLVLVGCINLLG